MCEREGGKLGIVNTTNTHVVWGQPYVRVNALLNRNRETGRGGVGGERNIHSKRGKWEKHAKGPERKRNTERKRERAGAGVE